MSSSASPPADDGATGHPVKNRRERPQPLPDRRSDPDPDRSSDRSSDRSADFGPDGGECGPGRRSWGVLPRRFGRSGRLGRRSSRAGQVWTVLAALLLLCAAATLSLVFGARPLSLGTVWQGLLDPDSPAYPVVREMRLPRTLLGLLAGAALGVAGAVMQALARNPLADPGLLGVNAGAAAAVVSAVTLLGVTSLMGYVWFAFAGAAAVSVVVWAVGGGRAATPARLALAGTAVNAALYSYVTALQMSDTNALDAMRFWTVGSLAAARPEAVTAIAPFVVAGLVLVALLARPLNALALGDESARALGSRPTRVRLGAVVAITLLCGAATAACGPIVCIGLTVPHLARTLTGPDLRRLIPCCAVLAPVVLLSADVVGRVLTRPTEIQVGVVTAVLGGPFFLYAVRRGRRVRA